MADRPMVGQRVAVAARSSRRPTSQTFSLSTSVPSMSKSTAANRE